eukprot:scaffold278382_cov19-Tisochrysis_lutea.AAC.1
MDKGGRICGEPPVGHSSAQSGEQYRIQFFLHRLFAPVLKSPNSNNQWATSKQMQTVSGISGAGTVDHPPGAHPLCLPLQCSQAHPCGVAALPTAGPPWSSPGLPLQCPLQAPPGAHLKPLAQALQCSLLLGGAFCG